MLSVRIVIGLCSLFLWQIGSNLGDNLDLLLRGVLSKLQQAETLSIIQVNHGLNTLMQETTNEIAVGVS